MNGLPAPCQAQIISRQMPKKRLQAVLFMAGTMGWGCLSVKFAEGWAAAAQIHAIYLK
jgi:hypothetical protein